MKENNRIVNDFTLTVATRNGSGSQTSNQTLLRALFKMGLPVSGKNLFPSNISGQPTWYTIRTNEKGYVSYKSTPDILITMNRQSLQDDIQKIKTGGVLLYADHLVKEIERKDIFSYSMPVKELSSKIEIPTKLKDYVSNMVYVGIFCYLFGLEMDSVKEALNFHFSDKKEAFELNYGMVEVAYSFAKENIIKNDPYFIEKRNITKGKVLIEGNEAASLGSIFGGFQFASWYPITPATSMPESLTMYAPIFRKPIENGKNTFAIVQAEDELASIGMAIGAGWGGLRSLTATSGPGISLMSEFIGLAYFAEVPVVIWDVQRVGPSTGLPTRTAQGDINLCYYCGHGDSEHPILLPGTINEIFDFGKLSLDMAECLQTPIFVLIDKDMGMNQWMADQFVLDAEPLNRGKVLWEEDLAKFDGVYKRYKDYDGDNIPYRTLMGNRSEYAAYFTRGTGHDDAAELSEDPEIWVENLNRLKAKLTNAKQMAPKPILSEMEGADIGIIAFGSTHQAIPEVQDLLLQKEIKTSYLRIRSIPFDELIKSFLDKYKKIYIVENNRDGQVKDLLLLEFPQFYEKMISIAKVDGLPLIASWIYDAIFEMEK
jgi:2-oxoglutarate ferredoxin oxidoreductase subunit alpha